jgi:hypothetical protein
MPSSLFQRSQDATDPTHELPLEERERRAEMGRKPHFARLDYLSAKARRRRRERSLPKS